MVRGLIIRGVFIAIAIWAMDALLLRVDVNREIELVALAVASLAGSVWVVIYCAAHEDEIPTYENRQRMRRKLN